MADIKMGGRTWKASSNSLGFIILLVVISVCTRPGFTVAQGKWFRF